MCSLYSSPLPVSLRFSHSFLSSLTLWFIFYIKFKSKPRLGWWHGVPQAQCDWVAFVLKWPNWAEPYFRIVWARPIKLKSAIVCHRMTSMICEHHTANIATHVEVSLWFVRSLLFVCLCGHKFINLFIIIKFMVVLLPLAHASFVWIFLIDSQLCCP